MNTIQKFGYTLMGAGIILVGIIIGSAVSTLTAQPADKGFAEILEGGLSPDLGERREGGLPLGAQKQTIDFKTLQQSAAKASTLEEILEIYGQRMFDDLGNYVEDHFELTVGLRKLCVEKLNDLEKGRKVETRQLLELIQAYDKVKQWHPDDPTFGFGS